MTFRSISRIDIAFQLHGHKFAIVKFDDKHVIVVLKGGWHGRNFQA